MEIAVFASTYSISSNMSGIGLRLWEISQLLAKDFQVMIYTSSPTDISHPNISFKLFDEHNWKEAIYRCSTMICSDLPDTRLLLYAHEKGKQIIVENSVPIEHIDYHNIKNSLNPDESYRQILDCFKFQLLVSDHFIARSSIERSTLLTSLALSGRLNYKTYLSADLSNLVTYIPIGFNSFSDRYAEFAQEEKHNYDFVWSGGVWGLYDIDSIPESIHMLNLQNFQTNLAFLYKPPADQLKTIQRINTSIKKHRLEKQVVFFEESISHFERDSYLKGTKAFVCLGRDSIENHTCHRLRLRDVFLYRKPIITDSFGATGDLIKQLGIGLTVSNARELALAMRELLVNKKLYDEMVTNIDKVRKSYLIDTHIDALIHFIRTGKKAADQTKTSPQIERFVQERPWLLEQLAYPI